MSELKLGNRAIDLTNHKFGHLTYIKPVSQKNRQVIWLCQCDCGDVCKVPAAKHSRQISCGRSCPTKSLDLTNHRFGSLTYIKPIGHRNKTILWLCQCDCGETCEVTVANRRAQKSCSKSCQTHSKSARARIDGIWTCEKHGEVRASKVASNCFE